MVKEAVLANYPILAVKPGLWSLVFGLRSRGIQWRLEEVVIKPNDPTPKTQGQRPKTAFESRLFV
jgi:hypothetical protein